MFAVKGSRFITHLKKLADVARRWPTSSPRGVLALERRLGPLLWQLPPTLGFDAGTAGRLLHTLPRSLGAAAELAARHDHRITADRALVIRDAPGAPAPARARGAPRQLPKPRARRACSREHDIALVLADNPGKWPVLDETTTDFRYVRLHGDTELYASGYTETALDEWATRIARWAEAGQDVYVYCDNDAKVRAPYDAMGLMERWGCASRAARSGVADLKRSLAHPKELTYPCCLPALGELGEVSPREGPATRVQIADVPPAAAAIRQIRRWTSEPSWVIRGRPRRRTRRRRRPGSGSDLLAGGHSDADAARAVAALDELVRAGLPVVERADSRDRAGGCVVGQDELDLRVVPLGGDAQSHVSNSVCAMSVDMSGRSRRNAPQRLGSRCYGRVTKRGFVADLTPSAGQARSVSYEGSTGSPVGSSTTSVGRETIGATITATTQKISGRAKARFSPTQPATTPTRAGPASWPT